MKWTPSLKNTNYQNGFKEKSKNFDSPILTKLNS